MPGSTSLKVDVIKVKDDFKQMVESWLARVELPGVPAKNESHVCEFASIRPDIPVDVHEACIMVNADGAMSVRDKPPDMVLGLLNGTGSCVSSRGSRTSHVRESRVKMRLVQLALRYEDRQKEGRLEEEKQRQLAEKQRQIEEDKRR